MASGASKSTSFSLLIFNFLLYFVITAIAARAINHGIEWYYETAAHLTLPGRLIPIYFRIGNVATGFSVIFSLIAGVVGMIASITGVHHITRMRVTDLYAAAGSSLVALSLTLLSLGLACKEIHLGQTGEKLRILEAMTIIVSATQLVCTSAIHNEILRGPVRY